MGTFVQLAIAGSDAKQARTAALACLERMAALEQVFSRFIPSSQLACLNREGFLDAPVPEMVEVLHQALWINRISGGAYDITVEPLMACYRQAAVGGNLPDPRELEETSQKIGSQYVSVDERRIELIRTGMAITLDSIAKGFIVDRGIGILRDFGFQDVMVDAGGDLFASGANPGNSGWAVGIRSPRRPEGELIARLGVRDRAVATSGDYYQAFTNDYQRHHILNPVLGASMPYLSSATVLAPSVMLADALATALMVMEPKDGLEMVSQQPECQALLVTKDQSILRS